MSASPIPSASTPRQPAAELRPAARPASPTRAVAGAPRPVLRRSHEPRQLELDLRRSL